MDTPHVTVNGTTTLIQRPQILLMQCQLVESAKTIADAISYFKERMTTARQMLEQNEPAVIEFGEMLLGEPELSLEALTARRIAKQQRRRSKGRYATPDVRSDNAATVRCFLRAQWPLLAESEEGTLTFIYRIQRALSEVAGYAKPEKKLTETSSWKDPHEEIQEMMQSMATFEPEEPDPRIPDYFYVSQISDQQLGEAFDLATQDGHNSAKALAKAAGKQLGDLKSIQESINYTALASNAPSLRRQNTSNAWPSINGDGKEFVGESLQAARFSVQVTCNYALI